MKLTKKDLKQFLEKHSFHTKKNVIITKNMAQTWTKKDLLCFIALQTWEFGRTLKDSLENAQAWSQSSEDEIIKTFFKKDVEKDLI